MQCRAQGAGAGAGARGSHGANLAQTVPCSRRDRTPRLRVAMGRLHTFVVTLRRDSREVNWGLRLVGGADLATPLIVTRVRSSL